MSEVTSSSTVYTPTQVGKRLGISGGMTRRYLLAYERVTGSKLPRDSVTGARLVSEDAMSELEQARALLRDDASLSVAKALGVLRGTITAPTAPKSVFQREEALFEELRLIHGTLEKLVIENEAMREQLKALEAPSKEKSRRAWWKLWG